MAMTDTSELDCMTAVLTSPKPRLFEAAGGCSLENSLQHAAGKCAEALLQRHHAEQKNGDPSGDGLEIRTYPETKGQYQQDGR